jgi:glycosyltransferase involved in cell wall biosynthesis
MVAMRLLIQGWRGINHSYALVNQFQLLEFVKRDDLAIAHEELPLPHEGWSRARNEAGFKPEDMARLDAIHAPDGITPDAIYRISYPCRTHGGKAQRVFCQGTSEYMTVAPEQIYAGPESQEAYPTAAQIITPSRWSKAGFLRAGYRDEAVHVVPHGVSPAYFRPLSPEARAQSRSELGIPPDRFVFLNLGAMTGNKGIDRLLIAFGEIHRRHPHAILVLKDQRGLYGLTADKVIAEVKTHFPGRIKGARRAIGVIPHNLALEQVCALYNACDAYVSPYRAEGFNLPTLEAAACGLPIAVTDGGATDDYVQPFFASKISSSQRGDGKRLWLEPDLDSLVDCMEAMIERRNTAFDPARAVRWIGENFSWAAAVEKLSALFRG